MYKRQGTTCTAPTSLVVVMSDYGAVEFTLTWTAAGGSTTSQLVKYRLQGDTAWVTGANITAANPQTNSATSAVITPGCTNIIIEFQVDSICSTGSTGTSIMHGICYSQQSLSANVTNGLITVTQPSMSTVDTIEYVLYDSFSAPVQTVLATGINPIAVFNVVGAGNYTVQYRYITSIDGTLVSSNDSSQHNAYYVSGTITVS